MDCCLQEAGLSFSPVDRPPGCFQVLVIINKVDIKNKIQVYVWRWIFQSLGQIPFAAL